MKFTRKQVIFILTNLVIVLVFLLLTLISLEPFVKNFTTALPGDYDELFITWSINNMSQNIFQLKNIVRIEDLFKANIFYPHPYAQAYSDPFILSALIATPLLKLTAQPITAFNFNLILSQFLFLTFGYFFFLKLTKEKLIAVLLSFGLAFSKIHLHYLPHLHTFAIFLLPTAGLSLLHFKDSKKIIFLYLANLCFILQMSNSFLPGIFIVFLALGLSITYPKLKNLLVQNKLHLIANLILSLIFLGPIVMIYFKVLKHFNYVRSLTEVIHFSLSPEEVVTKFLSPAAYFIILLTLPAILLKTRNRQQIKTKKQILLFLLGMGLSFIFSLGPALHWQRQTIKIPFHIPLPYLALYFLVPGFKGFRTPSRFINLVLLFGLMAGALSLKSLFKHKKGKILITIFTIFLLTLSFKKPSFVLIPQPQEYPPVYHWLKNQEGEVVIHLPIYAWGEKQETLRMLFSLYHKKNLINGYSGFFPQEYLNLISYLKQNFPQPQTILHLKELGIDYIILDTSSYAQEQLNQLETNPKLKKTAEFEDNVIYQFKE